MQDCYGKWASLLWVLGCVMSDRPREFWEEACHENTHWDLMRGALGPFLRGPRLCHGCHRVESVEWMQTSVWAETMECFNNILQLPLYHYLFNLCEYKVYVILKWMFTFEEKVCKFNNKVLLMALLLGLVVLSPSEFSLSHLASILFCLPLAWSEHSCGTWSHLMSSGWVQSIHVANWCKIQK